MPDTVFQVAARVRVLVPPAHMPEVCVCDYHAPDADHAMKCYTTAGGSTRRHDRVREAARESGAATTIKAHDSDGDTHFAVDVLISRGSAPTVALDVVVSNQSASAYRRAAARTPLHAAMLAEGWKNDKHKANQ